MMINVDMIYPIGSIYASVSSVNPGTIFGGTWVRFAAGRTLVGVDSSDSDFNTVEKTGGSKYLQAHTHSKGMTFWSYQDLQYGINEALHYSGTNYNAHTTISAGDVSDVTTGNSGNLQPYITVYYWKRTA